MVSSQRNRSKEKAEKTSNIQYSTTSFLPPTQSATNFKPRVTLTLFLFALFSAGALYLRYSYFVSKKEAYAVCSRGDRKGIYTVDANNSQVECMVVRGVRVQDTGSLSDVRARWNGPLLDVKYLQENEIVIPGISDSHCHILEYGGSQTIDLVAGRTMKHTLEILADYINSHPKIKNDRSKIIEGWGYDHASWDVPVLPTAADFDTNPTTRGRQIILRGRDGHTVWVSPITLAKNAPYPTETIEGGVIIRDRNGAPTGVFLDKAMEFIKPAVLTDEDLRERFQLTVDHALRSGLTSLHDAGAGPESMKFFLTEQSRGILPLRIYGMRHFLPEADAPYWGNTSTPLVAKLRGDNTGSRLSGRSVKLFADGALRSGGAALNEPYSDNPSTRGFMRIDLELLRRVVPDFLRDGWQVNIHAIGDRANGIILDTFTHAQEALGHNIRELRPRIEHAQVLTKPDMKRLGDLGGAISDMWYAQDRLGPERVKGLYAFRSILDASARITLGSDFPVDEINPLAGFFAAITRVDRDGSSPHGPGGWFPDQVLTRLEALRGMTIDPAFASFTEKDLGSLEHGKRADFVILSKDIMDPQVSPQEILHTKVRATVIDGRAAYGSII
ncbi:hypothetical protein DXG03_004132 [Asterophora parasitica]|uniref:Amidohydrolase 3 domain-containing protein n=1 Tax=Asterophora parasitica TaxID=117018 RepID=A0A9P7G0W4_9AGAR|nr:hypothetical protein DXG03_004132 [Asterophora parasitica]